MRNRRTPELPFESGTFKSPEFEYHLRSEDFVAEIPPDCTSPVRR